MATILLGYMNEGETWIAVTNLGIILLPVGLASPLLRHDGWLQSAQSAQTVRFYHANQVYDLQQLWKQRA